MTKAILILIAVVACGAVMITPCYSEYQPADENSRVFEGKVVGVDVGQSTLTVSGVVQIVFPISLETQLVRDIYDIKLSDIEIGDYVSVEYYRSGADNLVPSKVTKVTLEYDNGRAGK